ICLGLVLPFRFCQRDGLLDESLEIYGSKLAIILTRSIELAKPADHAGCVLGSRLDCLEIPAGLLPIAEQGGTEQQQFAETKNRHEGVIEIVRDPAGHLP